jgi:hypothetical protein
MVGDHEHVGGGGDAEPFERREDDPDVAVDVAERRQRLRGAHAVDVLGCGPGAELSIC